MKEIAYNFKELMEGIDRFIQVKVTSKKLLFKLNFPENIPKMVTGDKRRLRQVLINLLENAVKFTEEGAMSLNVTMVNESASHMVLNFSVEDTGRGISEEEQLIIFDFFSQGDGSSTRKYGGTGLGLSICKQLVYLMGGELIVVSKSGVGAAFSFEIKLKIE